MKVSAILNAIGRRHNIERPRAVSTIAREPIGEEFDTAAEMFDAVSSYVHRHAVSLDDVRVGFEPDHDQATEHGWFVSLVSKAEDAEYADHLIMQLETKIKYSDRLTDSADNEVRREAIATVQVIRKFL